MILAQGLFRDISQSNLTKYSSLTKLAYKQISLNKGLTKDLCLQFRLIVKSKVIYHVRTDT